MASITVEGDINKIKWNDRMQAAPRIDNKVRRVRGKWVTVKATRPEMSDWRGGSSRVTQH